MWDGLNLDFSWDLHYARYFACYNSQGRHSPLEKRILILIGWFIGQSQWMMTSLDKFHGSAASYPPTSFPSTLGTRWVAHAAAVLDMPSEVVLQLFCDSLCRLKYCKLPTTAQPKNKPRLKKEISGSLILPVKPHSPPPRPPPPPQTPEYIILCLDKSEISSRTTISLLSEGFFVSCHSILFKYHRTCILFTSCL